MGALRVQDLRFRVSGLGFGVWGFEFMVFRIQVPLFRVPIMRIKCIRVCIPLPLRMESTIHILVICGRSDEECLS